MKQRNNATLHVSPLMRAAIVALFVYLFCVANQVAANETNRSMEKKEHMYILVDTFINPILLDNTLLSHNRWVREPPIALLAASGDVPRYGYDVYSKNTYTYKTFIRAYKQTIQDNLAFGYDVRYIFLGRIDKARELTLHTQPKIHTTDEAIQNFYFPLLVRQGVVVRLEVSLITHDKLYFPNTLPHERPYFYEGEDQVAYFDYFDDNKANVQSKDVLIPEITPVQTDYFSTGIEFSKSDNELYIKALYPYEGIGYINPELGKKWFEEGKTYLTPEDVEELMQYKDDPDTYFQTHSFE